MFRANKHKLSWKLFSERKFVLVLLRRCFCISLSGLFAHEKRRKREKNTRKTPCWKIAAQSEKRRE